MRADAAPDDDRFTLDVEHCPACGANHAGITFSATVDTDGRPCHAGACPTTGKRLLTWTIPLTEGDA